MARFSLHLQSPHPADETWARVVDWKRHALVAPLTKVVVAGGKRRTEPDVPVVGERFVAHSGIGPLTIDDAMRVTRVEVSSPVRQVDVEKCGRMLKGTVHIQVEPSAEGEAVLTWEQVLEVGLLPKALNRLLAPVLSPLAAWGYRKALQKLIDMT